MEEMDGIPAIDLNATSLSSGRDIVQGLLMMSVPDRGVVGLRDGADPRDERAFIIAMGISHPTIPLHDKKVFDRLCQMMKDQKYDPTRQDKEGRTALSRAMEMSNVWGVLRSRSRELVKLLLSLGGNANDVCEFAGGSIPLLHHAAMTHSFSVMRTLLERGADPCQIDSHGRSWLHCLLLLRPTIPTLIGEGNVHDLFEPLPPAILQSLDLPCVDSKQRTPLALACQRENGAIIQLIHALQQAWMQSAHPVMRHHLIHTASLLPDLADIVMEMVTPPTMEQVQKQKSDAAAAAAAGASSSSA